MLFPVVWGVIVFSHRIRLAFLGFSSYRPDCEADPKLGFPGTLVGPLPFWPGKVSARRAE